MRTIFVSCLFAVQVVAQSIPGSYVVELQTPSMGALARNRTASSTAIARRKNLQIEQSRVKATIERHSGHVMGTMQNAINALIVDIPEANALSLNTIPGVTRVFPVTMAYMNLDHALPLHQVPQAWARIGGQSKAGLGMKIAILDTGITPKHPAFQDPTLTVPPGYPIVSGPENNGVVNNKIIVARNYAALYKLPEPDSAIDRNGHGTATADCAAGMPAAGPFATITGVAPKAFLGVYKISPLNSGGASTAVIAQALDDSLGDGMDVINLSFGSNLELFSSLTNYVIDQTVRLGVIVVTSAGNSGPVPNTIGDPADDANAISAGASQNDRRFGGSISATGLSEIQGFSGAYGSPNKSVTAPLADLSSIDAQGLGCAELPDESLAGQIALARTNNCTFESVLNNSAAAGAVGVIFYPGTANAPAVSNWTPLAATLPGLFVSNKDGVTLKSAIAAGPVTAVVNFEGIAFPNDPQSLAAFSSRGPTGFSGLKPDLSATGTFVYMATQAADPEGGAYNSTGYIQLNGTSFSSPIVAGAAAVLKAARPGLTVDQYRSLLINSATPITLANGSIETVQHMGAGTLNLDAAVSSTISVYPTSLTAGIGGPNLSDAELLTLTNVGSLAETFTIRIIPFDAAPAPTLATDGSNIFGGAVTPQTLDVTLAPKQSQVVNILWTAPRLSAGEYQSLIEIRGNTTGSTALVPFWYGVPDLIPAYETYLGAPTRANVGSNIGLYFKVTDRIGIGILNTSILNVRSSVVAGDGTLTGPLQSSSYVNYIYLIAKLSGTPGTNTFRVQIANFAPITVNIEGVQPVAPAVGAPSAISESALSSGFVFRPEFRTVSQSPGDLAQRPGLVGVESLLDR